MNRSINISTSTLFRFILIILGLVFLYLIRDILLLLFLSLIIAAAVDGPVDWLARHRVRRIFGAAIVYLLAFLILALFIYLVFPPLAGQVKSLATDLPHYIGGLDANVGIFQEKFGAYPFQKFLEEVSVRLSNISSDIIGAAINIFGGIFSAGIVLVISVYLVIQDVNIKNFLSAVTPPGSRAYVLSLVSRIQSKLGSWLRGQFILMAVMGALVYIGLTLLGVKFALTLALFAGLMEIIPYLGPIISATPAIILAFLQSPFLALLVLGLFVLAQQMENYLIAPQIMKRVVGLNPLVIIISMIIGGKLAGILGIAIAVPMAATLSVFLSDIFRKEN